MLISTISRPSVAAVAAAGVAISGGDRFPKQADVFVGPSSFAGGLSEVAAMAALAKAAKAQPKAELPSDLAAAVTAEFGKVGITGLSDQRLKTLTGYFVEGLETPFFDPLATLGEGWEQQQPSDTLSLAEPITFSRYGESVIQNVSFDRQQGTTTLHTVHSASFISTRHHQIVQDRDGKVVITDETAQ